MASPVASGDGDKCAKLKSISSDEKRRAELRAIAAERKAAGATPPTATVFDGGAPGEGAKGSIVKIVHLIRHGLAAHNLASLEAAAAGHSKDSVMADPAFTDPALTPDGEAGAAAHAPALRAAAPPVGRVFVSPLQRTLQTATLAFGGPDGFPCPVVAVEACRERWGGHYADRRRPLCEAARQFPAVDFSSVEHNVDALWKLDERETLAHVGARACEVVALIKSDPAPVIAVVTHSVFLAAMLNVGLECANPDDAMYVMPAELRSFVVTWNG